MMSITKPWANSRTRLSARRHPEAHGAPDAGPRASLGRDVVAGLTLGAAQVGNAMAYTLLAGVPPVHGLYATMAGTPVAAVTTGSQRMAVVPTAALSAAAGGALAALPPGQRVAGLLALTVFAGLLMLIAGLVRAGGLVRFISRAAMVGFMAGVATRIIVSQIAVVTGIADAGAGGIAHLGELLLHPTRADLPTFLVGIATVVLVVVMSKTRLRTFAMATALVILTAVTALLDLPSVAVVGDIAPISGRLRVPELPDLALAPRLLLPALALAIIALVQGAGISHSVRNADGTHGDTSRDFVGQGAANIVGGLFGGGPVGGSVQATALNLRAGARSRWSLVIAAAVVAAVLLGAAPLVEQVPLAVTGGILLVAAGDAIDIRAVRDVWQADRISAAIMATTFALTLVIPLQYAIFVGAGLSIAKHVYQASLDVHVVEITEDGGRLHERSCPTRLSARSVTVLDIYGDLFYAAAPKLRECLPHVGDAHRSVVVLRLRGRGTLHSATIALLREYGAELAASGGRLYLAGVGPAMRRQFERTGLVEELGADAIVPATDELYGACETARMRASAWLAVQEGQDATPTSRADPCTPAAGSPPPPAG